MAISADFASVGRAKGPARRRTSRATGWLAKLALGGVLGLALITGADALRVKTIAAQVGAAAEAAAYTALVFGQADTAEAARVEALRAGRTALPAARQAMLRDDSVRLGTWDAARGEVVEGDRLTAVVVTAEPIGALATTRAALDLIGGPGWSVVTVTAANVPHRGISIVCAGGTCG